MDYQVLDVDSFATTYGVIEVPSRIILYRGYNTNYDPISLRPSFYSFRQDVCAAYANDEDCRLGTFLTTHPLRFYDLRYIRTILSDLFPQRKSNCKDVLECCNTLALAYGICSYDRQLQLFLQRYPNDHHSAPYQNMIGFRETIRHEPCISGIDPVEARGVRIAETNNDAEAVLFLKEIFGFEIDGYIAPRLYSPYHIEKKGYMMNSEIVLFNPKGCGLQNLNAIDASQIKTILPSQWLTSFNDVHFKLKGFEQAKINMKGGKQKIHETKDTYNRTPNSILEKDDKHVNQLERHVRKTVSKLKGGVDLTNPNGRFENAVPRCLTISPWL